MRRRLGLVLVGMLAALVVPTLPIVGGPEAETRPPASAEAGTIWPDIVPRTAWDPDGECRPTRRPTYGRAVTRIFVHHTAIFPTYRPQDADDIVRAICVQHVAERGFDDIAYHFLIDQYGVIYQGRDGGILRPVMGAHAQGFNEGSIGIALIGNFDENEVPQAAVDSLDALVAWLVDFHGLDPQAVTAHTSTGGEHSRFPAGARVQLPTVLAHRDTAPTICPGAHLYDLVSDGRLARRVLTRLRVDYGWPGPDVQRAEPAAARGPASGTAGASVAGLRLPAVPVVRGVAQLVEQAARTARSAHPDAA